jgi:starvation-inducible outer membrane lipoprotein
MEYKLLRALSIFLQAGLVILLFMLLSLVLISCTSSPSKIAKRKQDRTAQSTIIEQRFLNETRQQRQQYKLFCQAKANSGKQLTA